MANNTWRDAIVQTKFRGKPFYIEFTETTFGRRTVVHEFPQQDVPFVEDLGEMARVHNIAGFVIGPDWEKQRNDLIDACRQRGSGKLSHPEYGEIDVICSNCTVSEDKTNEGMRATFDFVFTEVPTKDTTTFYVDTAEQVRLQAKTSRSILQKAFDAAYVITNLPQYATDFVSDQLFELTGFTVYQAVGVLSTFKTLTQLTDITIPSVFSEAMVNFTSSFNKDYTDENVGTKTITPAVAMEICITNASKTLEYPSTTTPIIAAQNIACQQMEQFFKQNSLIEAAVASTYIDYASYEEAQIVWSDIVALYDKQIIEAADAGNTNGYLTLRDSKAVFIADIKARAPLLNRVKYKKITIPTPALVIAYDEYEDIDREIEIINRNKISHPGFVISNKLELLVA